MFTKAQFRLGIFPALLLAAILSGANSKLIKCVEFAASTRCPSYYEKILDVSCESVPGSPNSCSAKVCCKAPEITMLSCKDSGVPCGTNGYVANLYTGKTNQCQKQFPGLHTFCDQDLCCRKSPPEATNCQSFVQKSFCQYAYEVPLLWNCNTEGGRPDSCSRSFCCIADPKKIDCKDSKVTCKTNGFKGDVATGYTLQCQDFSDGILAHCSENNCCSEVPAKDVDCAAFLLDNPCPMGDALESNPTCSTEGGKATSCSWQKCCKTPEIRPNIRCKVAVPLCNAGLEHWADETGDTKLCQNVDPTLPDHCNMRNCCGPVKFISCTGYAKEFPCPRPEDVVPTSACSSAGGTGDKFCSAKKCCLPSPDYVRCDTSSVTCGTKSFVAEPLTGLALKCQSQSESLPGFCSPKLCCGNAGMSDCTKYVKNATESCPADTPIILNTPCSLAGGSNSSCSLNFCCAPNPTMKVCSESSVSCGTNGFIANSTTGKMPECQEDHEALAGYCTESLCCSLSPVEEITCPVWKETNECADPSHVVIGSACKTGGGFTNTCSQKFCCAPPPTMKSCSKSSVKCGPNGYSAHVLTGKINECQENHEALEVFCSKEFCCNASPNQITSCSEWVSTRSCASPDEYAANLPCSSQGGMDDTCSQARCCTNEVIEIACDNSSSVNCEPNGFVANLTTGEVLKCQENNPAAANHCKVSFCCNQSPAETTTCTVWAKKNACADPNEKAFGSACNTDGGLFDTCSDDFCCGSLPAQMSCAKSKIDCTITGFAVNSTNGNVVECQENDPGFPDYCTQSLCCNVPEKKIIEFIPCTTSTVSCEPNGFKEDVKTGVSLNCQADDPSADQFCSNQYCCTDKPIEIVEIDEQSTQCDVALTKCGPSNGDFLLDKVTGETLICQKDDESKNNFCSFAFCCSGKPEEKNTEEIIQSAEPDIADETDLSEESNDFEDIPMIKSCADYIADKNCTDKTDTVALKICTNKPGYADSCSIKFCCEPFKHETIGCDKAEVDCGTNGYNANLFTGQAVECQKVKSGAAAYCDRNTCCRKYAARDISCKTFISTNFCQFAFQTFTTNTCTLKAGQPNTCSRAYCCVDA